MKKVTKSCSSKKENAKKGDKFVCSECGMAIAIEKPCGCEDDCYSFVCCDKPMKVKK
jgi:hypothetical protein